MFEYSHPSIIRDSTKVTRYSLESGDRTWYLRFASNQNGAHSSTPDSLWKFPPLSRFSPIADPGRHCHAGTVPE